MNDGGLSAPAGGKSDTSGEKNAPESGAAGDSRDDAAPAAGADEREAAPDPEDKCTPDQKSSTEERRGQETAESADSSRDWDAFSFQHEKLKHLTTVGLVLSGGVITLFRSEMMDPGPFEMIALALPVVSSMLTLAAQVGLGNEVSASLRETIEAKRKAEGKGRPRDQFGVPMEVHWFQLVAVLLLASALGLMAAFLFIDIGILPAG